MSPSRPVTTHEYDLMLELRRLTGDADVGLVVKKLGMSRPRANGILLKWDQCGWYKCGRDRFVGSLTAAGRITPIHSKGNRFTDPPPCPPTSALHTEQHTP
jgi:hypothetical protein